MSGYNNVCLLGCCESVEERTSKNGKQFVKTTIAVTTWRRNAEGTFEEHKSLIPVTIFGKQSELFNKYVRTGDIVHLTGRLDSSESQTSEGENRLTLSFVVEQVNLIPNGRNAKRKPSVEPDKISQHNASIRTPARVQPPSAALDENGDPAALPF
jgi:single stranded DNA-binding protein